MRDTDYAYGAFGNDCGEGSGNGYGSGDGDGEGYGYGDGYGIAYCDGSGEGTPTGHEVERTPRGLQIGCTEVRSVECAKRLLVGMGLSVWLPFVIAELEGV